MAVNTDKVILLQMLWMLAFRIIGFQHWTSPIQRALFFRFLDFWGVQPFRVLKKFWKTLLNCLAFLNGLMNKLWEKVCSALPNVVSYVYRWISVTYRWQILRGSWPYMGIVTICWITKIFTTNLGGFSRNVCKIALYCNSWRYTPLEFLSQIQ